ncbi:MAG: hypothetical protein ACHQ4H_13485 [Ktedonobacterales bacterium]
MHRQKHTILILALAIALLALGACDSSSTAGSDSSLGNGAPTATAPAQSGATATVPAPTACQVPPVPVATPGAGGQYVTAVVTAHGVDGSGKPIGVTAHFRPGDAVTAVLTVHGLNEGQSHLLSVRWYLGAKDISLQQHIGAIGRPVSADGSYAFTANYATAGVGTVKVYWDLPLNSGTLAQTELFSVGVSC